MEGSGSASGLITITEGSSAASVIPAVHRSAICSTAVIPIIEVGPTGMENPFVQTVEASSSALITMTGAGIAATEVHIPAASHARVVEGISEPGSVGILEGNLTLNGCDEQPEVVAEVPCLVAPTLFDSAVVGGTEGSSDPCICAICRDKIMLAETSQIKGCEHNFCVTCILRWALYKTHPWCPQCRLPFTELYVYRALDGSLNDYLFEESVCLLLRASWFKGMPELVPVEDPEDYREDEDCFDDYHIKSNVCIGNRRWGDNGYVRAGRKKARPVGVRHLDAAVACTGEGSSSSCSSRQGKVKGEKTPKEATGRRAKRAQKREAANKMASEKSQTYQQSQLSV